MKLANLGIMRIYRAIQNKNVFILSKQKKTIRPKIESEIKCKPNTIELYFFLTNRHKMCMKKKIGRKE